MSIPIVLTEKLYANVFFRWLTYMRPLSEFRIGGFSLREMLSLLKYEIYFDSLDGSYSRYIKRRFGLKSFKDLKNRDFIALSVGVIGSPASIRETLNEIIKYSQEKIISYYIGNKIFGLYVPSGGESLENIDLSKVKKIRISTKDVFIIDYPWEIPDYDHYLIRRNRIIFKKLIGFDEYSKGVYVNGNTYISPQTYFDTRNGPVFIHNAEEIDGFTTIRGPTIIREGSYIHGGRLSNTVIGPVCKVGGEISDSLVNGYSNMQHHSYVGHSYIGEWVNVGAGTVFSDLKNTYGRIRVYWNERRYDTGSIKVGSFVSDHVKFSINSSIFSGKFIGPFSHIYGLLDKNVPPFTIWNGYKEKFYILDPKKAVEIAIRVYRRRDVEVSKVENEWINKLFKLTEGYRTGYDAEEGPLKF